MISYWQKQIKDIAHNKGLALYGAVLSLTHVFTFYYWHRNDFFIGSQSTLNAEPLCYPFFANCDLVRTLIPEAGWQYLLFIYLGWAIVSALLFLRRQTVGVAYTLFAGLTLYKLALVLSNYVFSDGHHLMVLIISALFLLAPIKSLSVAWFVASFYFVTGLSKINLAWMTGGTLVDVKLLGVTLVPWALSYVILLETVFIFGLFHRKQTVRLFVLAQLVAMHLVSWPMVGFHSPLIAISLLSIFVLCPAISFQGIGQRFRSYSFLGVFSAWLVFMLLQAIPSLVSQSSPVGGVYRLGALGLAQPYSQCKSLLMVHQDKKSAHLQKPLKNLGSHFRCDPLVFLNQAKQLCRSNKEPREFERLSFALFVRPFSSRSYKKVIDLNNVCNIDNPLWAELHRKEQP